MASTGLCVKCGATNPRTAVLCGECQSRLPWAPAAGASGGRTTPRARFEEAGDEPSQVYPQELITGGQPGRFEQPGHAYPIGRSPRNEPGRPYTYREPVGCSGGGKGCGCSCLGCGCLLLLLLLYAPIALYQIGKQRPAAQRELREMFPAHRVLPPNGTHHRRFRSPGEPPNSAPEAEPSPDARRTPDAPALGDTDQ